ncbi:MAG: hypothetical protein LUD47_06025 [Clostridia bacterium]|nr:hypothetical protein [Clostridia bacterium]
MDEYISEYFSMPYVADAPFDFKKAKAVRFATAKEYTKLTRYGKTLYPDEAESVLSHEGLESVKRSVNVEVVYLALRIPEHTFLFRSVDDFMTACSMLRVGVVVWYNARCGFSLFDWYFLSHKWTLASETVAMRDRYGKIGHGNYSTLQSVNGARYKMTFWHEYINKNGDLKVHKTIMLDLVNVLGGGLKAVCRGWGVDLKTEYDNWWQLYTSDVEALYTLTERFENDFMDMSDLDFFAGDFLTAGGAAKKMLLKHMYKDDNHKGNMASFHKDFPMKIESDRMLRDGQLYRGGLCLLNPRYRDKPVENVYKYDVNSMYPFIMRDMELPYGKPKIMPDVQPDKKWIQILHIKTMSGKLKDGMIPVWNSTRFNYFTADVYEENIFIFKEEIDELENWYDLVWEIDYVLCYKRGVNQGLRDFVNEYYSMKMNETGSKRSLAKLILNSAYGKIAEKPEKRIGHYELEDAGYIMFHEDGVNVNKRGMMSIVVGARVTALARVYLLTQIRGVCGPDVNKNFVYCDTDSIHCLTPAPDTSDTEMGMLKNEHPTKENFKKCLYLSPKTYIMICDGFFEASDFFDKRSSITVHAKGVNNDDLTQLLCRCTDMDGIREVFRPGGSVVCYAGINIQGGKGRIRQKRFIAKPDHRFIADGRADTGGEFNEV